MTKVRLILIGCFVAAFAAGGAAGWALKTYQQRPHDRSWLMSELNLTAQQREQMGKIWSDVMDATGRQQAEQRRALTEERDKAIATLLTTEQQPAYERILQTYSQKIAELQQQRKNAFDEAVARTKQILTPAQAEKYDELLKRQRERPWAGPRGRHGSPRSMPATGEQRSPHGEER